jgi:NADPH-dependent 2,4-dienoyl-CoA reductase/sulfur reductase-like enzyme/pSer/pThr/pTyr-binding forkhead associated (FHA) protein
MAQATPARSSSFVIIGNGIAGITAAEVLRTEDAAADITVIADDPFPAYYRPALKDYLAGRVREDKLWARPTNFYQDHAIRFLADRVVSLQAGQHALTLQSGQQLGYDRLLLAHGARASTLTCSGVNLKGVTTLRSVADYQQMEEILSNARRVVVTGSGTLALETIETLRHRGFQVVHLLRRRTLWSEVLDATASDLVLQQEKRDGVEVRMEEEIAEITGRNGQVSSVVTTSGARIPCELVVMAIGIEPNIDFVKKSGIPCGRGLKVDAEMRTPAPDIYAAGDVLETTDLQTGRTRVIGQWYPAIQQARAAAYSMLNVLDSKKRFLSSTFYNATFLYGLEFASVGVTTLPKNSEGYRELVADPQPRTYRKVVLKNGIPVGALALGDRKDVLVYKRAIDHGIDLSPIASRLFAPDFQLNAWLDKLGVPPPILSVSRAGVAVTSIFAIGPMTLQALPALIEARLVPAAQNGEQDTVLSQSQVTTIGRQLGVLLLIDHSSISRRHAEISYANGQYVVRDLGSANGTFLNGSRLEANKAYPLKANDRLRFGSVSYTFQAKEKLQEAVALPAKRSTGATQLHAMATGFFDPSQLMKVIPSGQPVLNADGSLQFPEAKQALSATVVATLQESPALIVVKDGVPEAFYLRVPGTASPHGKKQLRIGRDRSNDVVIADVAVSRFHAELFSGPNGFYIRDLHSGNGVLVNRTKIANPYQLTHGDRINIGGATCYFMQPNSSDDYRTVAAPNESRTCNTCGASIENPAARFCPHCGTPQEVS